MVFTLFGFLDESYCNKVRLCKQPIGVLKNHAQEEKDLEITKALPHTIVDNCILASIDEPAI